MIRRERGNLVSGPDADASAATRELLARGAVIVPQVFDLDEVSRLRAAIDAVYAETPPRDRYENPVHRHGMLNKCSEAQQALSHPSILATIIPLLGSDCHVIANTAWRQLLPEAIDNPSGDNWHTGMLFCFEYPIPFLSFLNSCVVL
jgi:hypothetical protein